MAFIRRKKVNGYEYFQVVRNYRDSDGKHRQQVLDHLGRNDSLEAALASRREKVTLYQEHAKALSKRAQDLRAALQELYSDDRVGSIPSLQEAWEEYERAYDELFDPGFRAPGFDPMVEVAQIELDRSDKAIDYYRLISQADRQRRLAGYWQEKLNYLLDIQATYF